MFPKEFFYIGLMLLNPQMAKGRNKLEGNEEKLDRKKNKWIFKFIRIKFK